MYPSSKGKDDGPADHNQPNFSLQEDCGPNTPGNND